MMSQGEKDHRMAALNELFIGFGQAVVPERMRYYGNLTQAIPLDIFQAACRRAALESDNQFPPVPHAIIEAAVAIAPGARSPSHGYGKPWWYRKVLEDVRRLSLPTVEEIKYLE